MPEFGIYTVTDVDDRDTSAPSLSQYQNDKSNHVDS